MKPTTEGSKEKFDIICMSFDKENEKGLKVIPGGAASKESEILEAIETTAENSELREDNTLLTAKGNIINFEERAFEKLKENRNNEIKQIKKKTNRKTQTKGREIG